MDDVAKHQERMARARVLSRDALISHLESELEHYKRLAQKYGDFINKQTQMGHAVLRGEWE